MGDRSEHLRHLQDYARKVGEKEYDDESLLGTSGYGFRLKQTLQSLTETAVSEKAVIKKVSYFSQSCEDQILTEIKATGISWTRYT